MSTHPLDDLAAGTRLPSSLPPSPASSSVIVPLPRGRTRTSYPTMLQVPNATGGPPPPSPAPSSSSSRPPTPSSMVIPNVQAPPASIAGKYGSRIVNRLGLDRRWSLDSLCVDQKNQPRRSSSNQVEAANAMDAAAGWGEDVIASETTAPARPLSPLGKSSYGGASISSADAETTVTASDPSTPSSVTVSTSSSLVSRHAPTSHRWSRHPLPGEWPLDQEGKIVPGGHRPAWARQGSQDQVATDSLSSARKSDEGALPTEAIPKDILLLFAVWGVLMTVLSLVLAAFSTKKVDPNVHARRAPSRRPSPVAQPPSVASAIPRPTQLDTSVTSCQPPPMPFRHASFPQSTARTRPPTALDTKRSLSMTCEPVACFGLSVTEPTPTEKGPVLQLPTTASVPEHSESPENAASPDAAQALPDLIADDASNTASIRSSSPSSPLEDRKRLSFPGLLTFSNVGHSGHAAGKQRMSSGAVSPRTLSLASHSPPNSRKSSIIGAVQDVPHHVGDYHLSSIASVLTSPRSSHDGERPTDVGHDSPQQERKGVSFKGKLAAALKRKDSKVDGTSHDATSPSRSPLTSPAISRMVSQASVDGISTAEPRATRRRSSSVFSVFKRAKSDPVVLPPVETVPSPPNSLQSSKIRAKSATTDEPVNKALRRKSPSGPTTEPLEISRPLFPAHLPSPLVAPVDAARDALESPPRQRADTAPEPLRSPQSSVVTERPPLRPSKSANAATPRAPPRDRHRDGTDPKRSGRSNPYEGVPDWSPHIPGYERRRRRAEIRELRRRLGVARRWLDDESKLMPHDKQYKKDFIRWSREEARLLARLKHLRDQGMEGKELKEFDLEQESEGVAAV